MDTANGAVRMIPENVDGALLKRILDIHKPLDAKKFDARPLLDAVEDIIRRVEGSNGKASQGDLGRKMEPWIHETIKMVSNELSCKCSGATANPREVALELLQSLGSYSWEAKAVITLAAFAANYGSYLLVSQNYERGTDPFVKSVAFLQLSPNQLKQTHLTFESEALKVVKAIIYLTRCIVDVKTFQSQNAPLTSIFNAYEDDLAKAVYLSILSTVACESLLMSTGALGYDYEPAATDAKVFSNLAIELKNIRMELGSQMESWKKYIEEIIVFEDYDRLVRMFKGTYTSNMEILKALLCWKESHATMIYNCSTKMQEDMNKLIGKHVLLYFSNLEQLSEDEISILSGKYEQKLTPYEIVWVPIMDEPISWNEEIEKYFKKTRDSMPWYSINEPFKLGKAVIKYIKEVWKFKDRSQLVVLNPQGKFVKSGPVDLFWIWGKWVFASESTNINEQDEPLWKGNMIQLLLDTAGEKINKLINAGKYIFLFGGEDTKWIQEFVGYAGKVAKDANIEFVMVYVGKSNLSWTTYQKIGQNKPNFTNIFRFIGKKYMSSFWATLQSIWQTRVESGKSIVDDMTMEDIVTLLSFDASAGGWAAIYHGSSRKIAKARDETILNLLKNYTTWAALTKQVGFVDALIQKIKESKTHESYHDCYSLAIVANTRSTPKKVKCLICGKDMKSFITYSCCNDL